MMVAEQHFLTTAQVLVVAAYGTPNQDMAFVLGVTYNVLSSLLCGVWVTVDNLVSSVSARLFILGSRLPCVQHMGAPLKRGDITLDLHVANCDGEPCQQRSSV